MEPTALKHDSDALTLAHVTILIRDMDKDLVKALNEWRLKQTPPMEPNEAVIALLRQALRIDTAEPALQIERKASDSLLETFISGFADARNRATNK